MVQGYCQFCKKMVVGKGKNGRQCPTDGSLLAADQPKKKDESDPFAQGFSGTLTPEETLRFQRLQQAGLVKSADDVMKRGLLDLESRYLPSAKEDDKVPENSFEEALSRIEKGLEKKIAIQNLNAMAKAGGGSDGMNIKDMMEMMMLKNLMSQGSGENSQVQALQMQIQNMQQQVMQKEQDYKFQLLLSEMKSKGTTDKDVMLQIRELEKEHHKSQDVLRNEAASLRDKNYTDALNNLQKEIERKSSAENWNEKMQKMFSEKAMAQLQESFEKGLSGATPQKNGAELIAEVISNTTQQLAPAINQWIAQQKFSYSQKSQPPQSVLPAAGPEDQGMPEVQGSEQTEQENAGGESTAHKQPGGNVVTRLDHANDSFSE